MKLRRFILIAGLPLAFALFSVPAHAFAEDVQMEVVDEGDSKTLRQSVVVQAPVEDVWDAFTTEEGYTSWAVPHARIDLRIGGVMETSYGSDFTEGDPGNIKNRIIGFVPERMLVLKNVQAPEGFASREVLDRLTSVFVFEAVSLTETRVTVYGIGYGDDADSVRLIEFFKAGNAWTFEQLARALVKEN